MENGFLTYFLAIEVAYSTKCYFLSQMKFTTIITEILKVVGNKLEIDDIITIKDFTPYK